MRGVEIDPRRGCFHYRSAIDIVAIKFVLRPRIRAQPRAPECRHRLCALNRAKLALPQENRRTSPIAGEG